MRVANILPNVQLVAVRMSTTTENVIQVMDRFAKLEKWLSLNLDRHYKRVEQLLLQELRFMFSPSLSGSKVLDALWSDWADDLFRSIEDAALDLDFDSDRRILDEYIEMQTISRTVFL